MPNAVKRVQREPKRKSRGLAERETRSPAIAPSSPAASLKEIGMAQSFLQFNCEPWGVEDA